MCVGGERSVRGGGVSAVGNPYSRFVDICQVNGQVQGPLWPPQGLSRDAGLHLDTVVQLVSGS